MNMETLIENCFVENNTLAKYRLADSICTFSDADIELAETLNLQCDLERFEMIKSLMYKDIDGRRVYFKLENDSIYLYLDCTNKPTQYLSSVERENLSAKLNFTYNSLDYVKFAETSKDMRLLETVFQKFNVAYSRVTIEPRGNSNAAYTVLYNKEEDKVYDIVHEVYGVSALDFKKSISDNCRVLGVF